MCLPLRNSICMSTGDPYLKDRKGMGTGAPEGPAGSHPYSDLPVCGSGVVQQLPTGIDFPDPTFGSWNFICTPKHARSEL